MFDYPPP